MCDTQLSVSTPYGCKRRHRKPTQAPHPRKWRSRCGSCQNYSKHETSSSGYNGIAIADSQSSRQIHWSVRSRTSAKHISNQKVDSTCTGSQWSTPANTCRSRISRCTRPVQILPSFTQRRRIIASEIVDKPISIAWWFLDGTTIATGSKTWIAFSYTVRLPSLHHCLARCLWFLPSVQNTCFPWCTLCYPTNAKKHMMDYSDLSKRYEHFSIQRRSLTTLRWPWWTLFDKHFHV